MRTTTDARTDHCPHRATPATPYDSMLKAVPGEATDPQTHERVRHDRVDKSGSVTIRHHSRLHHIGIGRTHAGTRVILLVQDLHIRVVNAATGELLRELILDPNCDYQPFPPCTHHMDSQWWAKMRRAAERLEEAFRTGKGLHAQNFAEAVVLASLLRSEALTNMIDWVQDSVDAEYTTLENDGDAAWTSRTSYLPWTPTPTPNSSSLTPSK